MTTLNLSKVFVTLVSSGVSVSAYSKDRSRVQDMDGDVRTFAGGRQRAVTSEGVRDAVPFTLQDLTLSTVDTLRTWIGQTVFYRDHRGQAVYGTFFALNIAERVSEATLYEVSLTIRAVSQAESV